MTEFIEDMKRNYEATTRITLFNYLKTGNPAYDAIISSIAITMFSCAINYIYFNAIDRFAKKISLDNIKSYFYSKNTITIEGKRGSIISGFSGNLSTSSIYSDRFKALWNYIIINIDNNTTIKSIKETHSTFYVNDECDGGKQHNLDIFMVNQNKHFVISDDIFAFSEIEEEETKDEKKNISGRTDKIILTIYSYKYSVSYLKKFIDDITSKYLASIKENRTNQKFIYSLETADKKEDESALDCWREDLFESSRTFDNIFFDGKQEILKKINYFLNNRDWYFKKGIPYSLGIGLHGPPGTGKTSLIKALANYTNRHIIVISLKIIKTKKQLEQVFFESTYNENNSGNAISFSNKIIVFEDIDCIGDIVLNREERNTREKEKKKGSAEKSVEDDTITISNVLQSICELNETGTVKIASGTNSQLLTLDDILNLWDGIRETPGRILVISSNHYDKLDPALIRPGRIDITHELSNASHNVIADMYQHLFEKDIDVELLKNVKEYYYSPAEIINMYVSYKDENEFMNRLLENRK